MGLALMHDDPEEIERASEGPGVAVDVEGPKSIYSVRSYSWRFGLMRLRPWKTKEVPQKTD